MLVDDRELTEHAARIETLLEEVTSFPDPGMREKATEIVQGLLLLYGEGLARMLDRIEERGGPDASSAILASFAEDELIAHLLFLHDLHPVDVETRVAQALQEVRPYLESHGGNVELLGIEDGVAKLRLQGTCSGCPSSTATLKLAIEEAIKRAAPDLDGIEAEGVADPPPRPINFLSTSDIIPLKPRQQIEAAPAWTHVDGVSVLADGALTRVDVAGSPLLFARSEGTLYAYHDACAECGRPLDRGVLSGAELTCPSCGRRYDVRQAGRCPDRPDMHLQPVPLLVRDERVDVALGSG